MKYALERCNPLYDSLGYFEMNLNYKKREKRVREKRIKTVKTGTVKKMLIYGKVDAEYLKEVFQLLVLRSGKKIFTMVFV
jgi:hypothetical protein